MQPLTNNQNSLMNHQPEKASNYMKIRSIAPFVAGAWLAAISTAHGAAATTGSSKAAAPASAPVGVINEWLRQESDAFKQWDFGVQIRARYEVKENAGSFPNLDFQRSGVDNDNSYLLLREKVHIGYKPVDWFSAFVQARDSSTTGDDRNPNPEADQFDLDQAYASLGDLTKCPMTFKIGRQELVYGDERLVGNGDWGNLGRVFDAAKLRYEHQSTWVDAFVSRVVIPRDGTFNEVNDYDWFSGIYASTRALIPKQESQLYFLARNASSQSPTINGTGQPPIYNGPSARDIYSVGARMKSLPGQLNGWDYAAEAVGQFGSMNVGGVRLDHQAYAFSVGGGFTSTNSFGQPRVGLEYNFSSGDGDPKDDKNETLDNLFPTNHNHYGYMDLIGWRNIHDPRLSLSLKPLPKLLVAFDYHLFWLADTADSFFPESGAGRGANGYGRNAAFDSFIGSEVNLDATYNITKWGALRTGYGHFFTGKYIEQSKAGVGGARDADWFYLQLTINL